MKRIATLLAVFLMIPALALGVAALPDYQKDGTLVGTYACDAGKTIVNDYVGSDWALFEIRPSGGGILVIMDTDNDQLLFIKDTDSSPAKATSFEEFDKVFAERAPSFHAWATDQPNDCKPQ